MKVAAIIQARTGSTRLPGKVLLDLAGEPVLARCVERARRAAVLDEVVVATTTQPADEAITALCLQRGWPCFRGSEHDVLDRYYQAARAFRADVIVRITSDCPLIEPAIIDQVVGLFLSHQPDIDYASNALPPRTFPRGLDTEVTRFDVLERAWREDANPTWREHVTPYIYRNPGLFRLKGVVHTSDRSEMRWTLDTPEDLAFIRQIYAHFETDRFSWHQVLALLKQHPDWLAINRQIQQKAV